MIRICIGTEPKTLIPQKVLEHSILKHTKEKVEFYPMLGESWTNPNKAKNKQGTGFSLQRWYIPSHFLFQGKAIYLDADMLCFHDINELWNTDLQGNSIACTFQKDKFFERAPATSAMLIDCEKARTDWCVNSPESIDEFLKNDVDRNKYIKLMHAGCVKRTPTTISLNWNRFNKYIPFQTYILHYTVEPDQPWYNPNHPYKALWRDALLEAMAAGYVSKEAVRRAVESYRPHTCCERGEGMNPYWLKFAK